MYKIVKFVTVLAFILNYVIAEPQARYRGPRYSRPLINNGKNEVITNSQTNLTLICEAEEKITWTCPQNKLDNTYWSTVNVSTSKSNGRYLAKLTLYNASFVDVDYYYCHAENAAKDDPLRSDKIYVYVRDDNHLSVTPTEEIEFLTAVVNSSVILPCRPTSPDVTVTLCDINGEEVHLYSSFNTHIGYKVKVNTFDAHYECKFQRDGREEDLSIFITVIFVTHRVPKPYIEAPSDGRTKVGSTYTLNCTVTVEQNIYFTLNWTTPNPAAEKAGRITISTVPTVTEVQGHKQGSSSLIIKDVQHQDAGEYTCIITDHTQKNNSFSKTITVFDKINRSYINLTEETEMSTLNVTSGTPSVQWVVLVDSFPKAVITWYNNRGDEITKGTKYEILFDDNANKATLKIKQVTLNDSGSYKIVVNNRHGHMNLNFTLNVYD